MRISLVVFSGMPFSGIMCVTLNTTPLLQYVDVVLAPFFKAFTRICAISHLHSSRIYIFFFYSPLGLSSAQAQGGGRCSSAYGIYCKSTQHAVHLQCLQGVILDSRKWCASLGIVVWVRVKWVFTFVSDDESNEKIVCMFISSHTHTLSPPPPLSIALYLSLLLSFFSLTLIYIYGKDMFWKPVTIIIFSP